MGIGLRGELAHHNRPDIAKSGALTNNDGAGPSPDIRLPRYAAPSNAYATAPMRGRHQASPKAHIKRNGQQYVQPHGSSQGSVAIRHAHEDRNQRREEPRPSGHAEPRGPDRPVRDGGLGPDPVSLVTVEKLAALCALALDNARLYAQTGEATRRKDELMHVVTQDLRSPLRTLGMGIQRLMTSLGKPDRGPAHGEILGRTGLSI